MKTVFVLDTNPDRQIQMNHNLTAMGYNVRCFSSAAAFEAVNDKPFLIILDETIESTEKSGIQFLKKIHKMSGVPIIYTVTTSDKKLVADAKKMGAFEVIEKNPAEFVNLRTALDKIVNDPPKSGWLSKLFAKGQPNNLPALSV